MRTRAIPALTLLAALSGAGPCFAQTNAAPARPGLESLLRHQARLYRATPQSLAAGDADRGWQPLSRTDASVLRCARQTVFGLPVLEALARFEGGRLRGFDLSLYSRGEAGEVDQVFFDQLRGLAEARLTERAGRGPATPPAAAPADNAPRRRTWVIGAHRFHLEWSHGTDPFRAEYIRLRIAPHDPRTDPYKVASAHRAPALIGAHALKARVRRAANGDVGVAGLPMVAQREQFCAVATCERVLRYYGREVSQDQLGQAADADRVLGTSYEKLIDALRALSRDLDLRFKTHYALKDDDLLDLVRRYNKEARGGEGPVFREAVVDQPAVFYLKADRAGLQRARDRDKADRDRFFRDVKQHIDAGVPLMWTCMLAVAPADARTRPGGHMRTIVGYNAERVEVIYSDTWGAGHEWKRMPIDQAWLISTGLFTLIPEHIRL